MKKLIFCFVLTIMLTSALLTSSIAEEAVLLWETSGIIHPLDSETDLFKAYKYPYGNGVATFDGNCPVPIQYASLSAASSKYPGLFTVASENGINNLSLIDRNNLLLTTKKYGEIKIVDENWFLGIVLEEATTADYDYNSWFSDNKYRVVSYDVYHIPSGKIVGSLDRGKCDMVAAFGNYLLTEDSNGNVQLYDTAFNPIASTFKNYSDCEFAISSNNSVISRITGEVIASGYSSIYEIDHNYYFVRSSNLQWGVIDRNGNLVLPAEYQDIYYHVYYTSDHAYLKVQKDNLYGLYDLKNQKFVLPCEYDTILSPNIKYVGYHGYFIVEKNGKVGYVNASNQITCNIAYGKSAVTVLGCSMFAADLDGTYKLISADGRITPLAGVSEISASPNASLGKYVIAKNNKGLWGIIDWHGNLILDYCADSVYDIKFLDATHFALNNIYMYEIK